MPLYNNKFNYELYKLVKEKANCLDVGCWDGTMGYKLIKGKGCIVDGVDFNSEALQKAKINGYSCLFNINLNSESIDKELLKIEKKYDCIICADVIEHLISPKRLLGGIKRNLDKKGILVISVPNIAFIVQRIKLFFGLFHYSELGGIMDSTHLHFYTAATIKSLIEQSGYEIIYFKGYSTVQNKYFILKFLAGIYPRLFSMQFKIVARPI